MPYRFKFEESVEKGFRRIAQEQFDLALAELSAATVAAKNVHEGRKALKRLRALVRLAAAGIGPKQAKTRVRALGSIARLLSAQRDRAVAIETIASLERLPGTDAVRILAPLKRHLEAQVDGAASEDGEKSYSIRMLLLHEAKKISRLPLRKKGFAALSGGLETSYRRARSAIKTAYQIPSNENFHDLRKAVQWHWRQMNLLARTWPEELAVRAEAARELSQLLGDDHDLAMLMSVASGADAISPSERKEIAALVSARQSYLRDAAHHRAVRLFAEKPKAFVARVGAYWKFGQAQSLTAKAEVAASEPKTPVAVAQPVTANSSEKRPNGPKAARGAKKAQSAPPSQRRT